MKNKHPIGLKSRAKPKSDPVFQPKIRPLEDEQDDKLVMMGPMLRNDPRCSMNGPPPCPPAPKCTT